MKPKVIIANRGEIAVRICRAVAELGWISVALFTAEDANHTVYADESIQLDSPMDYMNIDRIVEIARRTNATHVHPGYGFLSESSALARALEQAGIVFIGPAVDALALAGDKMASRSLAEKLHIPVSPGTHVKSSADVIAFVRKYGFPVMIKALDGGGGRGIRFVSEEKTVEEAYARCIGESPSRSVFVERALVGMSWHHIEIQIAGDGSGKIEHFWERHCSVQRRFQKVVEIAPSSLPSHIIEPLITSAKKMAEHLKYKGLGTFEFLVNSSSGDFTFLEINPRVQVEHTITEEITGVDVVSLQLRLFGPKPYPLSSSSSPRGYAIQLRLTAEDPSRNFSLSSGLIRAAHLPSGPGVRVDTHLLSGAEPGKVSTGFDSLLAKIVVHGSCWEEAVSRAKRALKEVEVEGVSTNVDVLRGVVEQEEWRSRNGVVDTLWLERSLDKIMKTAASLPHPQRCAALSSNPEASGPSAGSVFLQPGTSFQLSIGQTPSKHSLRLQTISANSFPLRLAGTLSTSLSTQSEPLPFSLIREDSAMATSDAEYADSRNPSHVALPVSGKIVEVVKEGSVVKEGDVVCVVSAMKMESVVRTKQGGKVVRLGRGMQVGSVLREGALVCVAQKSGKVESKL